MPIKDKNPSMRIKRPRLTVDHVTNIETLNAITDRTNQDNQQQLHNNNGSISFVRTTDRWLDVFDSIKNTNHLKELHCR